MMEEEFYSTIKLSSGEEIIAKVCYLPEEESILVENPKLVDSKNTNKNGKQVNGFILKDWINSTYDNMFVIKMNQIITMTELDERIQEYYLTNINKNYVPEDSINVKPNTFSNRMGYLGSVRETKKYLENIFNIS
jgi:hypothetical protein